MRKILFGFKLITACLALTFWNAATAGAVLSGSFNQSSLAANDDLSSAAVPIGFTIDWDGVSYGNLYVNNNGNVTFDSPQSAYTPGALNTLGKPVIAPFFSDVDTTSAGSPVSYGSGTYEGRAAFGVNWINISCFGGAPTANNGYQMLLVNRSDTGGGNFDIVLNYDRLAWESGAASAGNSACLHGTPARAGFYGGAGGTNHYYYELPGSGVSGAMLDSGAKSLIAGHSAGEINGRYVFAIRNGRPEGMWLIKGDQPPAAKGSISCLAAMVLTGESAACTVAIQSGYQFVGWGDDCSGAGASTTCTLSNITRDQLVSAQILALTTLQISTGLASPSAAGVAVPLTATISSIGPIASGSTVSFCVNATMTDASCTGGAVLCQASLLAGATTASCNANLPAGSTHQLSAYFSGDVDHFSAASSSIAQTVGQFSQSISFTSTAAPATHVGSTYAVAATGGGSGNAVVFSIDASSNGRCSLANPNVVTFLTTGPCQINADQAGSTAYAAAATQSQIVTPGKSPQTITFTSAAPLAAKMADSYTVAATGGASGNAVSFSIDASSASICSIHASTVSFDAQGACVINANQLGNANFDDAAQVRQTVSIAQGGSGVSIASTPNPSMPRQAVTFTVSVAFDATKSARSQSKAAAVPTGNVEIFDGSTSLGVAALTGGRATLSTQLLAFSGDHSITAHYSGDSNYAATQSLVFTQTVMSPAPVPTLNQWAQALLALVLAGLAVMGMRRSRRY